MYVRSAATDRRPQPATGWAA
eukprot:COSAG01_NODE_15221_length_1360_cov_0.996035_1_plen_20_part_10